MNIRYFCIPDFKWHLESMNISYFQYMRISMPVDLMSHQLDKLPLSRLKAINVSHHLTELFYDNIIMGCAKFNTPCLSTQAGLTSIACQSLDLRLQGVNVLASSISRVESRHRFLDSFPVWTSKPRLFLPPILLGFSN